MRHVLPLVMIPVLSLALAAQEAGRIQGKITDKAGNPVADATITLVRTGTNVTKGTKSLKDGAYFLTGVAASEQEISYSAQGFVPQLVHDRIPVGGALTKDITLLTPEQALEEVAKTNPAAAAQRASNIGATEYNEAGPLYTSQNFKEALPHLEKAYLAYQETLAKSKDEKDKAAAVIAMGTVKRIYAVTLFEVGSASADKKQQAELWNEAEPLLLEVLPQTPETNVPALMPVARALKALAEGRKDQAAVTRYQAILERITPPNPAPDYNRAVDAEAENKFSEAKGWLEKALQKDPNYARAYYLLGRVEIGLGNYAASRRSFLKYLELEPTGEKAGEVKEVLKDPNLK